MSKIDIDKFICSFLKARQFMSDNENAFIIQALKDQGLYFRDGQIVTEIQKKLLDMSKPCSKEAIEKANKRKEQCEKKKGTKQCSAYGDKPQDCELYPYCDDCSGNIENNIKNNMEEQQ